MILSVSFSRFVAWSGRPELRDFEYGTEVACRSINVVKKYIEEFAMYSLYVLFPATKVKPIKLASKYMYPFGVRHAKCYPKMSVRTKVGR